MRSISPQALAAALILLTGCIAPRPESEGSVEEFERLLEESGGETVVAEDASTEPLEEPVAEAQTPEELDAEEAARVLEEIQEMLGLVALLVKRCVNYCLPSRHKTLYQRSFKRYMDMNVMIIMNVRWTLKQR